MELVVALALIVLVAVFLFSLWMLVVTCQQRRQYNRLIESRLLRFSKLHQDNLDDIVQLGPTISQTLYRNQWIEQLATDLLQHCVAVLKLCHSMTEDMAKISLDNQHCTPELNELICKATSRVMPRFEALLSSMANNNVDIRVIEARVSALVCSCWALTAPFAIVSLQHKEKLTNIINQMEQHLYALQLALENFDNDQRQQLTAEESVIASTSFSMQQNSTSQMGNCIQQRVTQPEQCPTDMSRKVTLKMEPVSEINIRISEEDEPSTSLLTDEAPTDPAIT